MKGITLGEVETFIAPEWPRRKQILFHGEGGEFRKYFLIAELLITQN